MTNIKVYVRADGSLKGYEASGHASDRMLRGNENDLVCGAVSVLTVTGVNALCSITDVEPDVKVDDGFLRCLLTDALDEKQQEKAQIILRTIEQGLTDIQKNYPKYIRIQHREWRQADAYDESSALRS